MLTRPAARDRRLGNWTVRATRSATADAVRGDHIRGAHRDRLAIRDGFSHHPVVILGEAGDLGCEPHIGAIVFTSFPQHWFQQLLRTDQLAGRARPADVTDPHSTALEVSAEQRLPSKTHRLSAWGSDTPETAASSPHCRKISTVRAVTRRP